MASSSHTIKRLVKDVTDIYKHPLTEQGIYYVHDEDNMYNGYAMIIGPPDTIYRHGFYLFSFTFTNAYPYKPPKVTFCTNNGVVRFHPNLYRDGKVCLSVLNTWKGESWTSCQSIRTILLTLLTLFDNKPFLHEPGIKESNHEMKLYNDIITYWNIRFSHMKIYEMQFESTMAPFTIFKKDMKDYIIKNKDTITEYIHEISKTEHEKERNVFMQFYKIRTLIDYTTLKSLYQKIELK